MIECEGKILCSSGTLRYHSDPYKLTVEVDPEIVRYYRSLVPKSIKLNQQMYAPHISVVRNEIPKNMEVWGKYDGQKIMFCYSNWVYFGTVYAWLNAFSEELERIRIELGLPVRTEYIRPPADKWIKCFHITIGNQKTLI